MRPPGDVVFAIGALLIAWDLIVKLLPLYPQAIDKLIFRKPLSLAAGPHAAGGRLWRAFMAALDVHVPLLTSVSLAVAKAWEALPGPGSLRFDPMTRLSTPRSPRFKPRVWPG
jgi:hypothetical protein